ncbi:MAG: TonB-dependent receptor [Desulfobacteraceae bacterium]|nr:TonB-dependent receptor [Desulfobacteraceae bacterium]
MWRWARAGSNEEYAKANPDLETETSWTYEIGGVKEIMKNTKFRAAAFYQDITDYQQHNYIQAAPSALVYNIDMVVYGLELELSRNFRNDLSGYLSYTFQDWDADSHPMDTEETHYLLQNQPKNRVVLGLAYKLWENGVVELNANYLGRRYSKQDDRMDDVTIVNLGAEHRFKLPQDCEFILKGYVNNVTDRDYQLRYGYDMPGVTAGISGTLAF